MLGTVVCCLFLQLLLLKELENNLFKTNVDFRSMVVNILVIPWFAFVYILEYDCSRSVHFRGRVVVGAELADDTELVVTIFTVIAVVIRCIMNQLLVLKCLFMHSFIV